MPAKLEPDTAKQLRLADLKRRLTAGVILAFGVFWVLVLKHPVGVATPISSPGPVAATRRLPQLAAVGSTQSQPTPGPSNGASRPPVLVSSGS